VLGDLETTDWSAIKHAYGPASDVPGLIRDLLSPDEGIRGAAISALFGNIWHQGTVYEASPYAVPFLQELLRSADTPDRLMIADLLAEMADGRPYLEASLGSEAMQRLMREGLAREGRSFEQELADSRRFARETKMAVGKDLPLLYPYLTCAEAEIRRSIANALKNYPERADETLPLLEAAALSERDAEAKQAMEEAIDTLKAETP
jgi:hypothetical protein